MKKLTLTIFLSILGFSSPLISAPPEYFNYQGLLKDIDGNPLSNGAYVMEFNIYDASMNGTLIWGPFIFDNAETTGHSKIVQISGGQFNVILGPSDTAGRSLAPVFSGDSAYVEIRVNEGDPILPRQRILSSPYSFVSTSASTLENLPPVQYRNPAGMLVPFAGTADKIPEGWLLCDGSEFEAGDYPELYEAIGKNWGGRTAEAGDVSVEYFNIPDMRGMFLRGANLGRDDGYKDPDASSRTNGSGETTEDVGSNQSDRIISHRHIWGRSEGSDNDVFSFDSGGSEVRVLEHDPNIQIDNVLGSDDFADDWLNVRGTRNLYTKEGSTVYDSGESRPNNAAVNYIIKI